MGLEEVGTAFGQSGLDFGLGKLASRTAWSRQKRVLQNSVRWRMEDLQRSGINPIIAAGGGLSAAGSGPSQQPPPNFSGASQSALALTQLKSAKQQIKLMKAQEGTARSQSRHYGMMGDALIPKSLIGLTAWKAYQAGQPWLKKFNINL